MTKNICILAGARPNFIKVSPLVRAISQRPEARCLLVYAGSADDPTLEASLFDDLQISRPQYYLGVVSTSLNEITSQVMAQFDKFLDEHPVDVVIVVDDLASTMAAAILSDYLFTAGVRSTGVATREQSEQSQTYMVGNILMDTLRFNRDRLRRPSLLPDLQENSYLVFTLNRKALLADKDNLRKMLTTLVEAAGSTPIIAPLRPEASEIVSRITSASDEIIILNSQFSIFNSLSYLEFGWLTAHAKGERPSTASPASL